MRKVINMEGTTALYLLSAISQSLAAILAVFSSALIYYSLKIQKELKDSINGEYIYGICLAHDKHNS